MDEKTQTYASYIDTDGETYYCPMDAIESARSSAEPDLDECVEASTVGRYAGNLNRG
jgi:hypothetical protein